MRRISMQAAQTEQPADQDEPAARTQAEVVFMLRAPGVVDAKLWFGFAPGVGHYELRTPKEAVELVRLVARDWRFNAWREGDTVRVDYVGDWN
jgi:hypothetical protein